VALIGPNGAGKTTLLRILAGVLSFETGSRSLGHNVTTAYFAQYYIDLLNPSNTILDEIRQVAPDEPEQRLRALLGAFLFCGEDVYTPVAVLSGGDKTRVALARMLVRPANFLLLDEPTNHLDIPSREILTDALQAYAGTICFITHDRTLIREVANKIYEIKDGHLTVFLGGYDDYLYATSISGESADRYSDEAERAPGLPRRTPSSGIPVARSEDWRDRQKRKALEAEVRNRLYRQINPVKQRIAAVEAEITRLGVRLKEIEDVLADPENYKTGQIAEIGREHKIAKDRIESLTDEWAQLTGEVERLTQEFEKEMGDM
jgi:ATP-binding cassette subfamily F protein 3